VKFNAISADIYPAGQISLRGVDLMAMEIPRIPGNGMNMPAGSGSRGSIDIERIMGCSAFRTLRLRARITPRLSVFMETLDKVLSLDLPQKPVENPHSMNDGTILTEAKKILVKFIQYYEHKYGTKVYDYNRDKLPEIRVFIERDHPDCNLHHLFAHLLKEYVRSERHVGQGAALDLQALDAVNKSYRGTVIFTKALEIISRKEDFDSSTISFIRRNSSQRPEVMIEEDQDMKDFLQRATDEDILKIIDILRYIEEKKRINFTRVAVSNRVAILAGTNVATVEGESVTIQSLTLNNLPYPLPEVIGDRIDVTARTIDIEKLMSSAALRLTRLFWHSASDNGKVQAEMLRTALSVDLPQIKDVKEEVSQLSDEQILAEADKVMEVLYEKVKDNENLRDTIGRGPKPSLVKFVESNMTHFNPSQLYGPIVSPIELYLDNLSSPDHITKLRDCYRKTLILTIALDILSNIHDFTPALIAFIRLWCPQTEKIEDIKALLGLEDEEIMKIIRLLQYVQRNMGTRINKITIETSRSGSEKSGNKTVLIKGKDVIIFTDALEPINPPLTSAVEKYIGVSFI